MNTVSPPAKALNKYRRECRHLNTKLSFTPRMTDRVVNNGPPSCTDTRSHKCYNYLVLVDWCYQPDDF